MKGRYKLFPISATKSGEWFTPTGFKFPSEKELKEFLRYVKQMEAIL